MHYHSNKYSTKDLQKKFKNTVKTNVLLRQKTRARVPNAGGLPGWAGTRGPNGPAPEKPEFLSNATLEDTASGNTSSMLEDLRDVSWANINSILDSSRNQSFQKKMKDEKHDFFSKFKESKRRKKQKKDEKEIQKIYQKVRALVGEASISSLDLARQPPRKRKKINIRKILRDFHDKFPEGYFLPLFDLRVFFGHFPFDQTDYHKMVIFLIKYADKAEVSINFLIFEKKTELMSLISKVFEVSRELSRAQTTLGLTRSRFMGYVDHGAEKFIRKRNLQRKRVRLEMYLKSLEWLASVRRRIHGIMHKIQTHSIEGIFKEYNDLQVDLEKQQKKPPILRSQRVFKTNYSLAACTSQFQKLFQEKFVDIKKTLARFFLDRFRYHFKEFLLIDLSQFIPPKTRQNLFNFLTGSEFSPSWQSQRDTREMWNPARFGTILDAECMTGFLRNHEEVLGLTRSMPPQIAQVHSYPENLADSLSSSKSLNFSYSLGESQDHRESQVKRISVGMLEQPDVSMTDHSLIVSKLFVVLNQLMSFDTGVFANEILGLFNPLSKQLRSELLKVKNKTPVEEIKKVFSPKDLKTRLAGDYFKMMWSFLMRLLLLVKVSNYAVTSCSRNKGVLLTDAYVLKVLGDLFHLLNFVARRLMLSLEEFVRDLFKHGLSFEELLGLKGLFISVYNTSHKQFFSNLGFAEEHFNLSEAEDAQLKAIRAKVSSEGFYNLLWKVELFTIKTFALNALTNLSKDVENENWADLNVSFDIIDMLRFIFNGNSFARKAIQAKRAEEMQVESENTLLKIQDKHFR